MPTPEARAIAREVLAERDRQDAKWGEQNHPDGTGPTTEPLHWLSRIPQGYVAYAADLAHFATQDTDTHAQGGDEGYGPLTWTNILLEEVFEALAEEDPAALQAELIQVAAVAQQWAAAIVRRSVSPRPVKHPTFTHAHARLVFLLSQTAGGTATRLERLWAAKVARAGALAWPFISSSGLRTRIAELKAWGVVEWSGDWGMTVSNRRSKVWRLAAIADGSTTIPAGATKETRDALAALRDEAGSDLSTVAVLRAVASAAGIR